MNKNVKKLKQKLYYSENHVHNNLIGKMLAKLPSLRDLQEICLKTISLLLYLLVTIQEICFLRNLKRKSNLNCGIQLAQKNLGPWQKFFIIVSLIVNYIGAEVVIYIYDITRKETFEQIKKYWIKETMNLKENFSNTIFIISLCVGR